MNPTCTQIPNAHFTNEARYRGARVVAIAPDYNASAIHAAWGDDVTLLRLQRGVPGLVMGVEDARARGIEDGNMVRVLNDTGSFEVQARISPSVRPGQVIVYDAWEPYQFAEHASNQVLTPNPINPIQLAGGYLHLQPRLAVGTPGASDRGTRVEVARGSRTPA